MGYKAILPLGQVTFTLTVVLAATVVHCGFINTIDVQKKKNNNNNYNIASKFV